MRTFFQSILGSCLGVLIAFLVIFLILFGVGASMFSGRDAKPSVKANTVLLLKLDQDLPELANNVQSVGLSQLTDKGKILGIHDYAQLIENAASDKNIKGIYINTGSSFLSQTKREVLEKALKKFRESGKFIYAYSEYFTGGTYHLASLADQIGLFPTGGIDLRGVSAIVPHFKDLSDKIGVEFETYFAGKFKSATEPFRLNHMSEENKLQTRSYLNSLYGNLLKDISRNRNIDSVELVRLVDEFVSRDAQAAKDNRLVDFVGYEDEMQDRIRDHLGLEEDEKINFITGDDYYKSDPPKNKLSEKNKIAVIYAEGQIHDGEEQYGTISGKKYVDIIRKIRQDKNVKAVVLRIDSPGGSALASEKIWRELKLLQEDGIPVLASMGTYAASGGYYIASGAEYIAAEPTTITGSIGVFLLMPKVHEMMNEKIGIHFDSVATNEMSAAFTPFFPSSPKEQAILQEQADQIYEVFLSRVAEARNMSKDQVNEIAQGRVWTGEQALDIHLVDQLGGLSHTIDKAAELSGISEYRIVNYPQLKDPLLKMLENLMGDDFTTSLKILSAQPSDLWKSKLSQEIKSISQPQARMPVNLIWD